MGKALSLIQHCKKVIIRSYYKFILLFYFICSTEVRVESEALHLLGKSSSNTPSSVVFMLFLSQGFANFTQAGLELTILLPLSPISWD
jgi:hypothetical protein